MEFDAVIIGGGINGLCTARELIKRGKTTAVLEALPFGHFQGSSHGKSRITRSAYSSRLYVELMQHAHLRAWPELEQDLGEQILYPTRGLFFGPEEGHIQQYAEAVLAAGAQVEPLSYTRAKKLFPQFKFKASDLILADYTAGLLAAEKIISGLYDWLESQGATLLASTKLLSFDNSKESLLLHTNKGTIKAKGAIFCGGSWMIELFPFLQERLHISHQQVYYWNIDKPQSGTLDTFPVWVEIGETPQDNWYGLPSFGQPGIKVAQHKLFKNSPIPERDLDADQENMRKRMQERLHLTLTGCAAKETCIYTVTQNEDFIWDHHPDDARIILGAGFSGHGFKFAPLTGSALAALLLNDADPFPRFKEAQKICSLST